MRAQNTPKKPLLGQRLGMSGKDSIAPTLTKQQVEILKKILSTPNKKKQ